MEGNLAICETDGDPFCIIGEGSFIGEFQVVKNIPMLFKLKAIEINEFDTQMEQSKGNLKQVASKIQGQKTKKRADLQCHIMCCDAKVFTDLCKLYPRSAELVKRDAEVRN